MPSVARKQCIRRCGRPKPLTTKWSKCVREKRESGCFLTMTSIGGVSFPVTLDLVVKYYIAFSSDQLGPRRTCSVYDV